MKHKIKLEEIEFHKEVESIFPNENETTSVKLDKLINEGELALESNDLAKLGTIFKQLEVLFLNLDQCNLVPFLQSRIFQVILSFVDNVDGRDVLIFYVADILTNLTQNNHVSKILSKNTHFMEVLMSLLLQHGFLYAQAICPIIHNLSVYVDHFHGQWGIALIQLLSTSNDEAMSSLLSATLMGLCKSQSFVVHLSEDFFMRYVKLFKAHLIKNTEQKINLAWGLYNMFNNPGDRLLFGGVGKNLSEVINILLESENIILNQIGLSVASRLIILQSELERWISDEETNDLICRIDDVISNYNIEALRRILELYEDESASLVVTLCANLIVNQFSYYYRILEFGIFDLILKIAEDAPLIVKREIGAFLSIVILMSPKNKLQKIVSVEYYRTLVSYAHLEDDYLERLIYDSTIRLVASHPEFIEVVADSEYVDFLECREGDENTPLTASYSAFLERIRNLREQDENAQ